MSRRMRYISLASLVAMMTLALAACGAPASPEVPSPTPTVAPPATAESPSEPTPTPGEEVPRGGTLVFCMWEDIGANLNPYRGGMLTYWQAPALQRLITWDPDGNPAPMLAAEVPTLQNGGLSEDGKTITYHLREGVKWADGEPFTCEDVKFTVEGVANPDNSVATTLGYELVDTVECPDPLTAVVKYREYYPPWITIPRYVLPKHLLEDYPDWNQAPWATSLLGTGPFYVTENVAGDHVTFSANPYYWEEGKPYLDQWIIKYVGGSEPGMALWRGGDCDIMFMPQESDLARVQNEPGAVVHGKPTNLSRRLFLNMSTSTGPNHGNPDYPHPVLGDARVRQAIQLAIDKETLVDRFYYGIGEVATTEFPYGYYADPTIEPTEHDPERAKSLLEDAGWADEDGDGIRECHGCLHAQEGDKAEITLQSGIGSKDIELQAVFLKHNMADVGILMNIELISPAEIWGVWEDGGRGAQGTFDIQMWSELALLDPQEGLFVKYHSSQIPLSATECGVCWNYVRYNSSEFDRLLEEAGKEPDPERRRELFSQIYQLMQEDVPVIYLSNRGIYSVLHDNVKGYLGPWDDAPIFEYITAYAGDIYIER